MQTISWVFISLWHMSWSQWLQFTYSLMLTSPCPSVTKEQMEEILLACIGVTGQKLLQDSAQKWTIKKRGGQMLSINMKWVPAIISWVWVVLLTTIAICVREKSNSVLDCNTLPVLFTYFNLSLMLACADWLCIKSLCTVKFYLYYYKHTYRPISSSRLQLE